MQDEPLPVGTGQGDVVVRNQHVVVLVEDVTITARRFLVYLVVVAVDHRDAHTVLGSQQQGVMNGQQHVEGLGGTAQKEVAAEGDIPDVHLPADVEGLPPVGRKFGYVIFGYVYVVQ